MIESFHYHCFRLTEITDYVKRILRRLYNIAEHELKKVDEQDRIYNNIIVNVFQSEPITWQSFIQNRNLESSIFNMFKYG